MKRAMRLRLGLLAPTLGALELRPIQAVVGHGGAIRTAGRRRWQRLRIQPKKPTIPESLYSCTQKAGLGFAPMVWLATTNTTRLPTTGPLVQRPIALARPTCGEKSRDQRRGGYQTGALYQEHEEAEEGELPLACRQWDDKSHHDPGNQQATDHEIGAAHPVGDPAKQRAERPDQARERPAVQEEGEAHMQLDQEQSGDRGGDVQLVIQRDGAQDRDPREQEPPSRVGIAVELPVPQPRDRTRPRKTSSLPPGSFEILPTLRLNSRSAPSPGRARQARITIGQRGQARDDHPDPGGGDDAGVVAVPGGDALSSVELATPSLRCARW